MNVSIALKLQYEYTSNAYKATMQNPSIRTSLYHYTISVIAQEYWLKKMKPLIMHAFV